MPHNNNFDETRERLLRRPEINFVEPRAVDQETEVPTQDSAEPDKSNEQKREKTKELVRQYKRLEELADLAQKRIDERSQGLKIQVPDTDFATKDSIKRALGKDSNEITYEEYRFCLEKISSLGRDSIPNVNADDVANAAVDPFQKDFGGFGVTDGQLDPDSATPTPVKPLDMDKVQSDMLGQLFEMLSPMITDLIREVAKKVFKEQED